MEMTQEGMLALRKARANLVHLITETYVIYLSSKHSLYSFCALALH